VQKLWYDINPSPVIGVFLILSTQMLGYGVAGVLRKTLVYPSKMFYPANLPTASLLENLHRDKGETKKKMRVFYIAFAVLFLWQAFPTYISMSTLSQLPANHCSACIIRCFDILSYKPEEFNGNQHLWWFDGKRRSWSPGSLLRLEHDKYESRDV
jgi:hypothetical protein